MNEERGLVKYEARDGQQVTLSFDTIKRYLVQGHSDMVTQQELMFFMGTCKSRGLNPFNKDCYLIKYSQKQSAAIITAVDYFRKRAKAQRDCHGWQKGIIVERKGEVVYSKGLMLDDDILLGGWFKAQPEGWTEPFELEVNLKGYIKKTKDGSITKFWQKENQPTQIAKVAESQGLRTLWPDEFQQLYTAEEMGEPDSFKSAEGIITDKAADLTDKIKETPNYNATKIETEDPAEALEKKLDEGEKDEYLNGIMEKDTKPTVDPLTGDDLEQGEPQGILPDGVDPIAWLLTSRGKSSPENADRVMRVFKAEEKKVESQSDAIKAKLRQKYKDARDHLAEIEANKKKAPPIETPPPGSGIPPFEQPQNHQEPEYDAMGRKKFLDIMKGYLNENHEKYGAVLNDNSTPEKPLNGMNDVEVSDQGVILGFMKIEFDKE